MPDALIPTAATLAAILNDPAIPSGAKPLWAENTVWVVVNGDDIVAFDYLDDPCPECAHSVNSDLFWSLSAWLWERGVYPLVIRPGEAWAAETRIVAQDAPTPIEALAAVVREVNASPSSSARA